MAKEDAANKEILIHDAVAKLIYFSRLYGIESLFIVGGYCRSMYFGRLWDINDIDVASAFEQQAQQLCGIFASEVLKTSAEVYPRSGASAVNYESDRGSIRIEFQGRSVHEYMNNQDVRTWLHDHGIEDTPLMQNIYGRDFTINALIFSLSKEYLLDPTEVAAKDLESGIVRSLLPAELLVKYNPLAILRAIRFALTYDFHIEESLRAAMKNGVPLLAKMLSQERIVKEIVRILKINGPDGLEMLKRYGLESFLLTPELKDYLHLEVTNG